MQWLFFLYFEMAQNNRPLFLVVPHGLAFDARYLKRSLRQTVCWQRHVRLSPLLHYSRGLRKTRHCPAVRLSQSISRPLSVTRMLLPLTKSAHTLVAATNPRSRSSASPRAESGNGFYFCHLRSVTVYCGGVEHLGIKKTNGSYSVAALGWICY